MLDFLIQYMFYKILYFHIQEKNKRNEFDRTCDKKIIKFKFSILFFFSHFCLLFTFFFLLLSLKFSKIYMEPLHFTSKID